MLGGPTSLLDQHGQSPELRQYLFRRQDSGAGGQDCRFDDRVLAAVEAKKVPNPAAIDDFRIQPGTRLADVDITNLEGEPAARVRQNPALHARGRQ